MEELSIDDLKVKRGEKAFGFVPVEGTDLKLPVALAKGAKDGPRVLISAGVHSAEHVGVAGLLRFARALDPAELSGELVMILLMNPSGFAHRTLSMVYEDGKNLNRVFPGNPGGTTADKIAATVVGKFFGTAERYVDLHSGDAHESLVPMVFSVGEAKPEVVAEAERMAKAANVRYLVRSGVATGGAYNHAGSMGIPSILIERGEKGMWSESEADLCVNDVKNVLRTLGLLEGRLEGRVFVPDRLARTAYVPAPVSGHWHPTRTAGNSFKKGETIGVIRDCFGNDLAAPTFEFDGVILYQVESLTVIEGENLIAYGGEPMTI
ncbi:MAG: succinylglutamate desuccinylase/aspartoacylase family protein [Deltaproteobacteria bacterium]|jgi:predicted deacylase|nr:succinylglutamate desuccinylase/aspartoacylase family protein [Deltaproteobacteria bacterium]